MSATRNITVLAKLLSIDRITLGRWVERYAQYMSPGATPPKGKTRLLNDTDVRVLQLIATLRNTGMDHDDIDRRLEEMQGDGWEGLPELPAAWGQVGETVSVTEATSRAYELAQVAVLQKELEHTKNSLQIAQSRVAELENLLSSKSSVEGEKHTLELELAETKGEVERLKAELKAYGMAYSLGRNERPLSAVTLVMVVALGTVVLVLIVAAVVVLIT